MSSAYTQPYGLPTVWTLDGRDTPEVSPSGAGSIYFDSTDNRFKVSQNGAAWVDLVGGGGGGGTLQDAYDAGSTISQTLASGPTTISNPAATAQATLVLSQATAGQPVLDASGGDIELSGGNYVVATGQRVEGTAELSLVSLGAGGVAIDANAAGTDIALQLGGASAWVVDGATGSLLAGAAGGDIGSSTVGERPDRVYVATEVVVGSTITVNGVANTIASSGNLSVDTAAAGTLNLGATNATTINLGGAASTVLVGNDLTVTGDLTVNGTTTTINSTSLAVTDRFILCANGSSNLSGGVAVSQANGAGNDLIFMWNDGAGRAEVGFGDSSTNPAGVGSFSDLKVSNVLVGGTAITADAGLTVTATGAALALVATGANAVSFTSHSQTIALNTAGDPSLDTTAQDIVGAINEVFASVGAIPLADVLAAGNTTGGSDIVISTGDAITGETEINLQAGTSGVNGSDVDLLAGAATTGVGGAVVATGGAGGTTGAGGPITMTSGAGGTTSGNSGAVTIRSGAVTSGTAGVVELGVGGASQWRVNADGHFVAVNDDTNDIGSAGANRPRRIYAGTEVVVGNTVTIGTASVTGSGALAISSGGGADLDLDSASGTITTNATTLSSAAGLSINAGGGGSVTIGGASPITLNGGTGSISGGATGLQISASGAAAVAITAPSIQITSTGATCTITANSTAIRLQTSGADRWEVTQTDGHLRPVAAMDNALDVGGTANRVRTGYFGTSVVAGQGGASAVTISSGAIDAAAALTIGGTTASSVAVGRAGVTTTVPGTLAVSGQADLDGGATVGNPAASSATLHVNGSLAIRTASIAANTTAASDVAVYLVDASGGDVTLTLPPAADCTDRIYHVKKTDASANGVIVEGDGAETIDGLASQTLAVQYESLAVISDGTEWWIF